MHNTKQKLSLLGKTQTWLFVQLYERGILVQPTDLNKILNRIPQSDREKNILDSCEKILAEEKPRIIKEIEEAFA